VADLEISRGSYDGITGTGKKNKGWNGLSMHDVHATLIKILHTFKNVVGVMPIVYVSRRTYRHHNPTSILPTIKQSKTE